MTRIRISREVDEAVWSDLRELARESNRSISDVLNEAITDYVTRHRVRPEVRSHPGDSIRENETLGRRLAR